MDDRVTAMANKTKPACTPKIDRDQALSVALGGLAESGEFTAGAVAEAAMSLLSNIR